MVGYARVYSKRDLRYLSFLCYKLNISFTFHKRVNTPSEIYFVYRCYPKRLFGLEPRYKKIERWRYFVNRWVSQKGLINFHQI